MRKIPPKIREGLNTDPFMKQCIHKRYRQDAEHCSGRIQFHHNFIYARKQQNRKPFILPLCEFHHKHLDRDFCDLIMLIRIFDSPAKEILKIFEDYPLYDFRFDFERLSKLINLEKL